MQKKTYDKLLNSKHRFPLMLFLFLNALTAAFFSLSAAKPAPIYVKTPSLLIVFFSIFVLARLLLRANLAIKNINNVVLLSGLLWTWQIFSLFQFQPNIENSYLLILLINILFISAIALGDHLTAFFLHTLPAAAMVLYLDSGHNLTLTLFTITLPLIGFTLHHLMLQRRDSFTRRLLSQLHEEKETFSDLSMLDPLTGLYNRRGLQNRLTTILEQNTGDHFVLLLDVDNFKAYNDNYGHTMGDQALAGVSAAIRDAVRSRDIVTRYGGEEFLVLLTHVNENIALKLAERIRERVIQLEIPHRFNDQVSTHVTLSAGIAPLEGKDFDGAVANADRALYLAKNQGRNMLLSYQDMIQSTQPHAGDSLTGTAENQGV